MSVRGAVEIQTLKIITTNTLCEPEEVVIDPTNIVSLDIFESLDFPGVTGKLALQDWSDIKERYDIFAGDKIEVSFGRVEDEENPLVLSYVIHESSGDENPDGQINKFVTFGFCSYWLIDAFTAKRSRSWTNKTISQIVAELVAECLGEDYEDGEFESMGYFVETDQVLERFVSPYWTPIETIQYLMTHAVSVADGEGAKFGGYIIWTDIMDIDYGAEVINFMPITQLMSEQGVYGDVPFSIKMNPLSKLSAEKAMAMQMEQSYDIIKYAASGLARTKLVGFDYDTTSRLNSDRSITGIKHSHLSSKLPLNKKFNNLRYRATRDSVAYPNTTNLITNENMQSPFMAEDEAFKVNQKDLLKGKLLSKMAYTMSDVFKMNVMTVGEAVDKRVGNHVKVIYSSSDQQNPINNQYSGWYLIRNNRHTIQGMSYVNIVTLVSDGYKAIYRNDMLEWEGGAENFPETSTSICASKLGGVVTKDPDSFDAEEDKIIPDQVEQEGIYYDAMSQVTDFFGDFGDLSNFYTGKT